MYNYLYKHARKITTLIIVILFTTSLWQLATAGWIQGKAIVAQHLLNHAWDKTVKESAVISYGYHSSVTIHKPWPWADTWPVAKLLVPEQHIEHIVLAGDSGSSLAFGPGHSFASAAPNTPGLSMISGHRDTHFRFLKDLRHNDRLDLQTTDTTLHYRVSDFQVVDSRRFTLLASADAHRLVLVTCYPFDAISSGGPLRYLVYAQQQPM